MPEIGATLREARMRARIDVSEIEQQTKIRAKYLRALENEEWDLLPGPTYVKSFLRTYAQALGLDAKLLLEEYRLRHERPTEAELQPIVPTSRQQQRRGPPRVSRAPVLLAIAVAAVAGVLVLLVIGLVTGGTSKGPSARTVRKRAAPRPAAAPVHRRRTRVTLQLVPSSPVYVCLIGDGGRKLISGVILQPGRPQPAFHARRFLVTLGNNAVALRIDGRLQGVPSSASAIGYSISLAGRRPLPTGQLPTCA
jgi:cytoskeleton protein RodZ